MAEKISDRDAAALEAAGGLISTEGIEDPKPKEAVKPAGKVNTGDNPAQQLPGAGQAPKVGDGQPQKPVIVKTAFGTETFGAQEDSVLSSFEDVQAFAKEQGVAIEKVDDLRQLFTQVTDLKKTAGTVPQLEAAVGQYKAQIDGLPADVTNILNAAISGKDYRGIIKDLAAGAEVDLSKPFSSHDSIQMIQRYVDSSITKEKFDELVDANKDAYNNLAKSKYEGDQVRYTAAQDSNVLAKQEFDKKWTTSIQTSLQNLKTAFPDMDEPHLKHVADKMQFGLKESLFNADNTYKPEAAIKIAMQEFGQEAIQEQMSTIKDYAQKMGSKIEGELNEQLITRSDKPDLQGRQKSDGTNVVSQAVDQATDFL